MVFEKIDAFLAKHVFHPPIIAYCQATGFTQWRVSRDLWFIGVAVLCVDIGWDWTLLLIGPITIIAFLRAALLPQDRPEQANNWRGLWVTLMALDIISLFSSGILLFTCHTTITFACYAATIPTIPPKKRRDRKRKLASESA